MIDSTSLLDYCCHDDAELASHGNSTGTDAPSSTDRNVSASVRRDSDSGLSVTLVMVTNYLVICVVGLVGNTLVVSVITRFAKMKTVTNVYILNLSVADGFFLIGLPMIATTSILRHWAFGSLLCKVYYVLTSINMFTGGEHREVEADEKRRRRGETGLSLLRRMSCRRTDIPHRHCQDSFC